MKVANPRTEVPAEVERVVLQCLEKDPARRPQSARELFEQFRQAAGMGKAAVRSPSAGTLRSRRTAAVAAALVLVAGIGLGAALIARGGRISSIVPAKATNDSIRSVEKEGKTITPATSAPAHQSPRLWEPKGYAADDPNDIVPDHPGFPVNLRRLDDGVLFVWFRDRVYIPEGYEPESLNNLVGALGWPSVIIRKQDKARFILIEGAVYRRGDPRGAPDLDSQNKPMKPHYLRLHSFYMQETEVTNGEIENYARQHRDEPGLNKWRGWLEKFQVDHPNATKYPAVFVDYHLARKFAHSVGGLLPTERNGSGPPSRGTTNTCLPGVRISPHRPPAPGAAWMTRTATSSARPPWESTRRTRLYSTSTTWSAICVSSAPTPTSPTPS